MKVGSKRSVRLCNGYLEIVLDLGIRWGVTLWHA